MPTPSSLWSDEHRLALAVIAGASVVMLAFGFLSIGKAIRQPFDVRGPGYVPPEERDKQAEQALKVRDTDGDGLTDYDEISVYRTSAYIADSDSDGVPDGREVKDGGDPNCPQGRTCEGSAYYAAPPAKVDASKLLPQTGNPFADFGAFSGGTILDTSVLAGFDAAKIRALLKASGMSEDQLSKVSDEQLEQVYAEALAEQVPTSTVKQLLAATSTAP